MFSKTTGQGNIALGAGSSLTTGGSNIHIGHFGIAGEGEGEHATRTAEVAELRRSVEILIGRLSGEGRLASLP